MSHEIKDHDLPNCLRMQMQYSELELFMGVWNTFPLARRKELQPYYEIYMRAHNLYVVWVSRKGDPYRETKSEMLRPFIEMINSIDPNENPISLGDSEMFEMLVGIYNSTNFLRNMQEDTINFDKNKRCIIFDSGLLTFRMRESGNDPEIIELLKKADILNEEFGYYALCLGYLSRMPDQESERDAIKKMMDLYYNEIKSMIDKIDNLERKFFNKKHFESYLEIFSDERVGELTEYLTFYTEVIKKYDEWKENGCEEKLEEVLQPFIEKSHSITTLSSYEIKMFNFLFVENYGQTHGQAQGQTHGQACCRHWHPKVGFPTIDDFLQKDYLLQKEDSFLNKVRNENILEEVEMQEMQGVQGEQEEGSDYICDIRTSMDDSLTNDPSNNHNNNQTVLPILMSLLNGVREREERRRATIREQQQRRLEDSNVMNNADDIDATTPLQQDVIRSVCEDWQMYGRCMQGNLCEYYHPGGNNNAHQQSDQRMFELLDQNTEYKENRGAILPTFSNGGSFGRRLLPEDHPAFEWTESLDRYINGLDNENDDEDSDPFEDYYNRDSN